MELLKIAFRNIFRNSRRTILTITVIMAGITFSICGLSWFNGVIAVLQQEGIKVTGDIRVTDKEYDIKEKILDVSSNIDFKEAQEKIGKMTDIRETIGRIKFGGLVFKGEERQKEALGFGIEPKERENMAFDDTIYMGRFLDFHNKNEIIVGEKIKNYLNLNLGDEITVMTRTQYNSISALNYKIVGFYKMDNGKMNQSFYITLEDAQYLLDMENRVTEYLVFLKDGSGLKGVKEKLAKEFSDKYLIKQWKEIGMNGAVVSYLPTVQKIILGIFVLLAGIGVANTMIMVVFERKREIGVMKALGMENGKIGILLSFEGAILGLIGAALGSGLGSAIAYYLSVTGVNIGKSAKGLPAGINWRNSIIHPLLNGETVAVAFTAGVVLALIATMIPVVIASKKEAAETMRI